MKGWETAHIDDLDAIDVAHGLQWRPVRRRFGIRAFGINAYTTEHAGDQVVEEHNELGDGTGAGGHEEIYFVVRGRATFTIDGETLDAPAGTLVFIREPSLKRVAIAEEEGTLVLAVGGPPGQAYEVSAWEFAFASTPLLKAGRYDEAVAMLDEGLAEHPGNGSLLYNLACAEALMGKATEAVAHLQEALTAAPKFAAHARTDPDFDAIRGEPGFPR